MANRKAVSDEQIITALMAGGTIRTAAAALNVSERCIYDRMNSSEFQSLYSAAKADLIRAAVTGISQHLQAAIDTIAEVMTDPNSTPAVRLNAAQLILSNGIKFAQRLQMDDTVVRNTAEKSRFSLW